MVGGVAPLLPPLGRFWYLREGVEGHGEQVDEVEQGQNGQQLQQINHVIVNLMLNLTYFFLVFSVF